MDQYSSKLLNNAVEQFSILPGVGRRTALRLVLHLLKLDKAEVKRFAESIAELKTGINFCRDCFNISDSEVCSICSDPRRQKDVICLVEDIRDVIAIENTSQFRGLYHVLGGVISPIDGIGPDKLNIASFLDRVSSGKINEVIMALGSTMEGDTTHFYLYKKIKDLPVRISAIARGMAVGEQLEFTDELTLGRSIRNRIPYEQTLGG